ncbi:MAG TPA: DHH family phosphoesterase [Candidatus Altiarchaeales archaeon]|nr:DHH family phosphoesterase [Candidatus Altiarchaeales archaeon]
MEFPVELESHIKEFNKKLLQEEDVLVVSHHDADGITSCAITVDLLRNREINTEYKCIKQLDSVTIGEIEEYGSRTLVFTDMGSGQLPLLAEHNMKDFYVIDHHPPAEKYSLQVNPHDFGYDGGSEVSGAGMAYFVAKTAQHMDMAHLAVVGAVGDMQDSDGELKSLNRILLQDGENQGTILVEKDLRMFGRQSRSLIQMLAYSSEPILPEITGSQQAAAQFIENAGIDLKDNGNYRNYVELDRGEREKLASAIYMHLLDYNMPEYIIQSMVGEVYTLAKEEFKSELRDAKEYATVLNACGRQEKSELGVEVCLGDRGVGWHKAKNMLESHRRNLREGIEFLREQGTTEMKNFYYFDGGDKIKESIIGVIAGMAYGARIIPPDKPVLAFAQDRDDEDMLKVSGRANKALLRRGIHLGEALRETSKLFGGEGGGHDIAAGARFPKQRQDEFLQKIDEKFAKQLGK